jgi:hypothetical protein
LLKLNLQKLNEYIPDSEEEEDGVEETKNEQKIFTLAGIKSHEIELETDPTTGRLLISKELISLLDIVLSNPNEYKKALPRATETTIKAFISCVAYIGGSGLKLTKNSQLEFLVLNDRGLKLLYTLINFLIRI